MKGHPLVKTMHPATQVLLKKAIVTQVLNTVFADFKSLYLYVLLEAKCWIIGYCIIYQ